MVKILHRELLKKLAHYSIKHSKLNWKLLNCTAFPTEETEEILSDFRCGKAVKDSYTLLISHWWIISIHSVSHSTRFKRWNYWNYKCFSFRNSSAKPGANVDICTGKSHLPESGRDWVLWSSRPSIRDIEKERGWEKTGTNGVDTVGREGQATDWRCDSLECKYPLTGLILRRAAIPQ